MTARGGEPAREATIAVAYLTHVSLPSGAELSLLRQIPHIPGVAPIVIAAEDGPMIERFRAAGIPATVLALPERTRRVTRSGAIGAVLSLLSVFDVLVYSWRLARLLRRLRVGLVHTSSMKATVYGPLAARLAGIGCVIHLRDRLTPEYLGTAQAAVMRLWVSHVADGVIANSPSTLATLGPTKRSTRVVPSAVVRDPATSIDHVRDRDRFRIVMVGRLAEWKGQHVLIEAIATAPGLADVEVVIAGAALFGEHGYEERIREQTRRLGLEGVVTFLGHVDDIPALLARSTVLVHASTLAEPFGQVVAEGMVAGLAVVGSDAGGPSELIVDGKNGLLVPPGDVTALAEALVRLRNDPELVASLGEAAEAIAVELDPQRLGNDIASAYATLAPLGRIRRVVRRLWRA
jgi:glycosyltransferase involved in cell wall biosynthesis